MTTRGVVNARLEAVLRLRLRGPEGVEADIDAVIDTGYTGSLTLPAAVIATLGLAQQSGGHAILADGTTCRFETFMADVAWGDAWREVVASALGEDALVGMSFLAGNQLRVEVAAGGAVEVAPLQTDSPGTD